MCALSYVIEHGCPSFHGDALEDGEHSKQDVVELSDAVIRANPGIFAAVAGRTLTHATRELQLRGVHRLVVWQERCVDGDLGKKKNRGRNASRR